MIIFKRIPFCLLLLLSVTTGQAQQAAAIDSIKTALAEAVKVEDKVYLMDNLSRALMNVSMTASDSVGKKLIELAEESRDRKLMIKAYVSNGIRYSYLAGTKDFINRSLGYYDKALVIAKQNKLEDEIGGVQLQIAYVNLTIPDKEKALSYVNQAFSVISTLNNDSLEAEGHSAYGYVYLAHNEKILALRHYFSALRIAEQINDHTLIRSCYVNLSRFYSGIEAYDKAIDYSMLAYKKLDEMTEKNVPYQRVIDMSSIGSLYSKKKSYDMAISYYERSLAMADSLKFSTLKVPAYLNLLNQYLRLDQPQKALDYFNSSAGQELKIYFNNFNLSAVIDQAYAVIYTKLLRFDSAKFYFNKASTYFETATNEPNKMNFYQQLAELYKKTGENAKAIEYYLKVKEMANKTGALEYVELSAKHLDSLYARMGNYQLSSQYNSIYYQYKDSTEKLNKEKELAQVEAADEQQRLEREQREIAERKRRKNNIQYLSITIGIVALFVVLVILGMFKVSAGTIRFIGFFAFLMFFEFIFLLFKKNINSITHGEPLKDLAFMIGLAAVLVPLHHWLEKRVMNYLTSHNRLTQAGKGLRERLFKRTKPQEQEYRP